MHDKSYNKISEYVKAYLDPEKELKIVDVGSMDVNGAYKPLFNSPKWSYTGIDIEAGKNVDKVVEPYKWDIADNSFDVVVSGQCLEHCRMPWVTVQESVRVLKPGGIIMLTAPWSFSIHRYPIDCWRILPDGMQVLLADIGKCEVLKIENNNVDTYGVGRKPVTS